jgi:hypothetical protein
MLPQTRLSPTYLATRYAHPLDCTIRYLPLTGRWYIRWYVKSDTPCVDTVSVTTLVDRYVGPSVPSALCLGQGLGHRASGVDLHRTLEWFFNGYGSPPMEFLVWWDAYQTRFPGIRPLRTEMIVRSSIREKLIGVVDVVLLDTLASTPDSARVHLLDWKYTSHRTLGDTSLRKGALQLNMYQYLLETF